MSIDFESLFGDKGRAGPAPSARPSRLWYLVLVAVGLLFGLRLLVDVYIDALWFDSLGQAALFRTRILAPLAIFGGLLLLGGLWLAANWLWASRRLASEAAFPGQRAAGPASRGARPLIALAALVLAGGLALSAAGAWQTLLLYGARGRFDRVEPILGRDAGFYVFELPAWQLLHGLASSLALTAILGTALIYALGGAIEAGGALRELGRRRGRVRELGVPAVALGAARRHLMLLLAVYALLLGVGAWLGRFALLTGTRPNSVFFGPGFADITARMPAYAALALLWALVALLLVVLAFVGRTWPALVAALAVLGLRLLAGEVYPSLVQQYRVQPNELARERPYIEHAIALTRAAWGLDGIDEVDYEPRGALSAELLDANRGTLDNVRLWDWQVLLDYFEQKQSIRPYYDFRDVDIDRYPTADGIRQVELAARELQPAGLRNPTWISRHLEYTHGFGLAMVPVDEVDGRGQPVLWTRDLPVSSSPPFEREVRQPRIYFGEGDGVPYVVVDTLTDEFDYPLGDENARTVYDGADGVRVGSVLRRLAFALHFGDIEILLSNDIEPSSRVLMRRQIAERVRHLAPFLAYDGDPYLVLTEAGRLVWILDAYTLSDRFPYAEPVRLPAEAGGRNANYLRNSVKVVVDAYDGQPAFYVVEPDEPIIQAWQRIFPGLFQPAEAMPEGLVAHWRYPETLFQAQTRIFERYHVTRADVFYNGEDLWSVPMETRAQGDSVPMEPYYVTMRLRDEETTEFLLMRPFTPAGKKNMIAWLAARSDPGHYGHLVLYNFGKGRQVDGPEQIESRIDNNTEISAQLTLWSQAGSRTIRGNLLVIPLGDALLYVEPLYLQAESNALPELKRVIVADGERVAMRETFEAALTALMGGARDTGDAERLGAEIEGRPLPDAAASALPEDLAALIATAREAESAAGRALEAGDWRRFGVEMDRLSRALERLGALTGGDPLDAAADGAPTATDPGALASPEPDGGSDSGGGSDG